MHRLRKRAPWIALEAFVIAVAIMAMNASSELALLITPQAELIGAIAAGFVVESVVAYIAILSTSKGVEHGFHRRKRIAAGEDFS